MNYLPTTHVLVMTPRFDAFTVKLIYYPRATIQLSYEGIFLLAQNFNLRWRLPEGAIISKVYATNAAFDFYHHTDDALGVTIDART